MDRRAPPLGHVARALHEHSVHDPYCLLFGPDNPDRPGLYLLRVMLAVPEDSATDLCWTAASLEQARDLLPAALTRWPRGRTTSRPGLLEQWCLSR